MKIVAISGSLRSASHNTAVLEAIRRLAPPDVAIGLFDGIGKLPFFNSDIEAENLPEEVVVFRQTIGAALSLSGRGERDQSSFTSMPRLTAGRAISTSYQRLTLGKSESSTLCRG
ncbi:NADPH-dependent FMN reductase [Bradyrhizobium sp.]|uniref:NADPH-dependent FMN reductase n=1 Tax=Bradyrhizobium sp. TaxID=376 RepID=UPI003C7010C5